MMDLAFLCWIYSVSYTHLYNNWEWIATSLEQQIKHKTFALYTPLSNKFFEKKMQQTRGKFGLTMVSIKKTAAFFEEYKNIPTATIFGIDQSPRNPDRCYWMDFLNQDTGCLLYTSVVKIYIPDQCCGFRFLWV